MTSSTLAPWLLAWISSAILAGFLVLTKNWHGRLTMDSMQGVQKFHTKPTPRIGGVAIAGGLLIAWHFSQGGVRQILGLMLLAGIPAFAFGLLEDLSKKVSVSWRLSATICSGLLACWLMNIHLTRVNITGVDLAFASLWFAIPFTAFAVGGVANALNITDGLNGLAAGAYVISMSAMGLIALQVGDADLAAVTLIFVAVALGFLCLNFPLGKIFLGDGGAYLLGFLLAWVAILLPMRNASVSVWATLLACAYPVLETFFSMWRKFHRVGYSPGQPDNIHLHQLIYRRVARQLFPTLSAPWRNGLSSPFCWLYALLPASLALAFYANSPACAVAFAFSALVYGSIYRRLTRFRWG